MLGLPVDQLEFHAFPALETIDHRLKADRDRALVFDQFVGPLAFPESDPPQEPPIIKVPSDWRSEPAILSKITPNMAMFSEWTDEELDDSNDFIEQIAEITDKNTEWKQQVMACQIVETTRRHLQRQDKKRA